MKNIESQSPLINLILEHAYTRSDALRCIQLTRRYFENMFFDSPPPSGDQKSISNTVIDKLSQSHDFTEQDISFLNDLASNDTIVTPTSFSKTLEEVSEQIKSFPVLTLYTPINLSPESIKQIGIWARENLDQSVLLWIETKPQYVGGCAISWNGRLTDYSITRYEDKQKETVKNLLNKYSQSSENKISG